MSSTNPFQQPFNPSATSFKYHSNRLPTQPSYPMDIADMDFPFDPSIKQQFLRRISQCTDFTYKQFDNTVKDSIRNWYLKRRNITIQNAWLRDSPSVAQSLMLTILACTLQGEGVMVFTPVYDYFLDCPKKWNRQCVYSRLLKRNGRYVIDVEDVKGKLERTRLVLLCNPHNPSGQVFTRQELQPLVQVLRSDARDRKAILWSDELLADMAYGKFESCLAMGMPLERLIVADSISKAFNVSSFQGGYTIIPNQQLRKDFDAQLKSTKIGFTESAMLMIQSCYMEIGENWLKRLVQKFKRNFEVLDSYCKEKMSKLIFSKPEAGYCIVIDFKNYKISSQEMLSIFDKAGVLAKKMDTYYEPMKQDVTEVRLCIACPTKTLLGMLNQLSKALSQKVGPMAKL